MQSTHLETKNYRSKQSYRSRTVRCPAACSHSVLYGLCATPNCMLTHTPSLAWGGGDHKHTWCWQFWSFRSQTPWVTADVAPPFTWLVRQTAAPSWSQRSLWLNRTVLVHQNFNLNSKSWSCGQVVFLLVTNQFGSAISSKGFIQTSDCEHQDSHPVVSTSQSSLWIKFTGKQIKRCWPHECSPSADAQPSVHHWWRSPAAPGPAGPASSRSLQSPLMPFWTGNNKSAKNEGRKQEMYQYSLTGQESELSSVT